MSETRHYGPGSDAGARRWAIANTLIQSCKLNGVEPLAYLTDVLQRIVSERFGISHTTLQVDHEAAEQGPLQIEVAPRAEHGTASYTRPQ